MQPSSLKISQILCPTDFSIFSARAFRHALALAHQFGAQVKVVHVLPTDVVGLPFQPTPMPSSPAQRQDADAELRRFVEAASGSGVEVTAEIRDGDPWREILAVAREMTADLVTLGTHGRSGFVRFALGSVTERLLGHLHCPTLTVCREEGRTWEAPGLIKRILCATDFSEAATESITLALALASRCRSEVTLLHVIDELPDEEEYAYYAVPEIAPLRKALEEQAWPRLQAALPEVLPPGITVEKRLATGRAHEKILEVAAEQRTDLIVLGTRGHGPLGRIFLGSASQSVVREATCPVVTVPRLGVARILVSDAACAMAPVPLAR